MNNLMNSVQPFEMRAALMWTLSIISLFVTASARAADWPQWQGLERDSVSKEAGLLQEWPKEGPPLAWKVKGLGGGYSSPSVVAGRIYGMSNRGNEQVVWALSEADGKELWARPIGPAYKGQRMSQGEEGPACTPTVDSERLYIEGNGGELACLQTDDGKIIWQRSLSGDFGGSPPAWAYRESPLVDGDKVIVTPGAADALLVALNKATGETIWKSQMPAAGGGSSSPREGAGGRRGGRGGGAGAGYASPISIDFDGQRQYVQFTARALVGVAAADGKILWQYAKPANGNGISCTTPLHHQGTVFASSAYGAGGGLVKLTKSEGTGVKAEEVYFTKRMQNMHGGVVVVDGCLYGADGGTEGGFLACIDFKTGDLLWNEREDGRAKKGSVALADGRLYYRVEDGTMLLIEPNRKEYIEKGRFQQPDRTRQAAWPHPVIANGKLYLRDQDVLLCYDVKAK